MRYTVPASNPDTAVPAQFEIRAESATVGMPFDITKTMVCQEWRAVRLLTAVVRPKQTFRLRRELPESGRAGLGLAE